MTQHTSLATNLLQFYATAAYPCSYLQGHIARSQVADFDKKMDSSLYSELVRQGFRRSGGFVYRPHCDHCQACQSIRVPVNEFQPSRSQRRALRKYDLLEARICSPHFSDEHYELYQRYQKVKHAGGGMDHDDSGQYIEFLVNTEVNSYMVEFREHHPERVLGTLRMVSIIDQLEDGLSAVYTFYDPQEGQSYGTYNVLWQIQQAQTLGLPYVYLGYWIESCRKMSYKTRFRPCELFNKGTWQRTI